MTTEVLAVMKPLVSGVPVVLLKTGSSMTTEEPRVMGVVVPGMTVLARPGLGS